MTESTDRVLASIDEAIAGYVSEDLAVSDDAMRWQPEEPENVRTVHFDVVVEHEQDAPWIAPEVWERAARGDAAASVVDWFSEYVGDHMVLSGFQRAFLDRMYESGTPHESDYARARRQRYAGWSDAWRQAPQGAWCTSTWLDELPAGRVYVEGYRPDVSPGVEPRWDDSLHASLNRTIDNPPHGETGWTDLGHTTDGGIVYAQASPRYAVGGLVPDTEDATRSAHELLRAVTDGVEQMRPRIAVMGRAFGVVGKVFKAQADRNHVQLAPRLYRDDYRRHRIRCRLCNPAGNPKPLAVNGAEYRRRTRARRRRDRR